MKPLLLKRILQQITLLLLVSVGAAFVAGASSKGQFVHFFTICLAYTTLIWSLNIGLLVLARNYFPGLANTAKRLLFQVPVGTVLTVLAAIGIDYLLCTVFKQDGEKGGGEESGVRTSLIMTFIVMATTEAIYFFKQWKLAMEQANALQEANLRSQLGRLKAELNPHFLFNNFNTLAAVIEEDPRRATRMLEALSRYYRYVLKGESHLLSTLEEELESLQAYAFLLQIRHEDAFVLRVKVSDACKAFRLPTLTLQTLAENATKHNAVTLQEPLILEVFCHPNGVLEVRNNLVARHGKAPGAGIGLSNLKERSNLLGLGSLEYEEVAGHFVVTLPMLPVENYSTIQTIR